MWSLSDLKLISFSSGGIWFFFHHCRIWCKDGWISVSVFYGYGVMHSWSTANRYLFRDLVKKVKKKNWMTQKGIVDILKDLVPLLPSWLTQKSEKWSLTRDSQDIDQEIPEKTERLVRFWTTMDSWLWREQDSLESLTRDTWIIEQERQICPSNIFLTIANIIWEERDTRMRCKERKEIPIVKKNPVHSRHSWKQKELLDSLFAAFLASSRVYWFLSSWLLVVGHHGSLVTHLVFSW